MQIERYIKTLSRTDKEKIIKQPLALSTDPRIQPDYQLMINNLM